MVVTVNVDAPRDATPPDLDGVILVFPVEVTWPAEGFRKDETSQHKVEVSISGTLFSMWGFGHFFERPIPEDAVKTLFAFAKEKIEQRLRSGSFSEVEQVRLHTGFREDNPFDVEKIDFPADVTFAVKVRDQKVV